MWHPNLHLDASIQGQFTTSYFLNIQATACLHASESQQKKKENLSLP